MLDELLELFERDNERGGQGGGRQRKRGIRGFFSRLFGRGDAGGAAPADSSAPPAASGEPDRADERRGRTEGTAGRRERERDEGFDFD